MDDEERDVLTEKKFFLLIDIHNLFQNSKFRRSGFRSLNHIGQTLENSPCPSSFTKQVLAFMLHERLIVVSDENTLTLDVNAFEKFVEDSRWGKKMFAYVDEKSALRL